MSYETLEKQIKALPEEAVRRIELYVKDVAKMYAISDRDWPKCKLQRDVLTCTTNKRSLHDFVMRSERSSYADDYVRRMRDNDRL